MGIIKEFKEFAVKGNAIDLAVGIIIGGGFGKIVSSLVNDIIMPPISVLIGINFKDIKIKLKEEAIDLATGKIIYSDISINVGNFIQTVFDFLIIAFVIFLMVKGINNLKKKEEAKPVPQPGPSAEEKLLTEIRDLLKDKK